MCLLYVFAVHDPPAPQPTVVARIPGSRVGARPVPPRGRHPSSGDPDRLGAWGFARFFECRPVAPSAGLSSPADRRIVGVRGPQGQLPMRLAFSGECPCSLKRKPGTSRVFAPEGAFATFRLPSVRRAPPQVQTSGWEERRFFSASSQNFPTQGPPFLPPGQRRLAVAVLGRG